LDRQQLGRRLRSARENIGLTQEDVGRALSVTRATIARYESGSRQPGASEMVEYAHVLRVSVSWLYDEQSAEEFEDADAAAWYNGLQPNLKPAARAALKAISELGEPERVGAG
jgi:transcriptional regulator with XRE-family HTH domain